MSITEIKNLATQVKESSLIPFLKSSGAFGNSNPFVLVRDLLKAIEDYKEPNPQIDVPPKPKRTRRATRKVDPTE